MRRKLTNIAIIPARMGSKRIEKKNIKNFNSKPMIEWTFRIIKKSNIFQKIVLSSESNRILNLGRRLGFDILIKRPKNLADDHTGTIELIQHAIRELEKEFLIKNICCVYPCNPFIQIKDLKKSIYLLNKNKNSFVVPITNFSHPIERAYSLNRNGMINFINNRFAKTRTQDLKKKFYDVGQFFLGSKKTWFNAKSASRIGLQIPSWRAIDIDNADDWKRAKLMFKL